MLGNNLDRALAPSSDIRTLHDEPVVYNCARLPTDFGPKSFATSLPSPPRKLTLRPFSFYQSVSFCKLETVAEFCTTFLRSRVQCCTFPARTLQPFFLAFRFVATDLDRDKTAKTLRADDHTFRNLNHHYRLIATLL
jgi:hypothetical protein